MHCALIMAAGAKARVIISKALWKRKETLYNVMCAIKEPNIIIIIIIHQIYIINCPSITNFHQFPLTFTKISHTS